MNDDDNILKVAPGMAVPVSEFSFTFARSGGPGGQNVNKVNSKAILHWMVVASPSVPDDVKMRFCDKFASRISADGEIIITSQKFRDQSRNANDCLDKLREMLASVTVPPKRRRATKPTKASKVRRVESKSEHSQKKQRRRSAGDDY